MTYKLAVVNDHPLYRGALIQAIGAAFPDMTIIEAGSHDELTEPLPPPGDADLILSDLEHPGSGGLGTVLLIRAEYPAIPLVICSAYDEAATMRQCFELGAVRYIAKSEPVERIIDALREVRNGVLWSPPPADTSDDAEMFARLATLTPEQVKVLIWLREGLFNKQIAFRLGVSEATVKAQVPAILLKLGVDSRTQAVNAIATRLRRM